MWHRNSGTFDLKGIHFSRFVHRPTFKVADSSLARTIIEPSLFHCHRAVPFVTPNSFTTLHPAQAQAARRNLRRPRRGLYRRLVTPSSVRLAPLDLTLRFITPSASRIECIQPVILVLSRISGMGDRKTDEHPFFRNDSRKGLTERWGLGIRAGLCLAARLVFCLSRQR